MMQSSKEIQKVKDFYDQDAEDYKLMYKDEYVKYPANLIRLRMVIKRLKQNKVKTILDAGCGSCAPMITLLKEGFQAKGFDFSEEMVKNGKKELKQAGYDPNLVIRGDLEKATNMPKEKFDAVLALGVFPHIVNEAKALRNMRDRLVDEGLVFIEFRNDLFAAYTLNDYSLDFFLNNVINLKSLPNNVSDDLIKFYQERMKVDKPIKKKDGKIVYTDILSKFHNPLSIAKDLFEPNGFCVEDIHFYHYHALPPIFQDKYPDLFKDLSLKMEKPNDWRGYLMASAYVVEAKKV